MDNDISYNPTGMLSNIGGRIKQAREEQDISQKDLGMSLGLSDKAVSAYEASRTVPPLETLVRIPEELNKPLDYFIRNNAPDYKLETQVNNMEQAVLRMLQEIKSLKQYLQENPQESDSSSQQNPPNPKES